MNNQSRTRTLAWVACMAFGITAATSTFAVASGLSKPVIIGPKAIGMGGAFVAVADDPSAIFHNPAGMTQIKGLEILAGADAIITDLDHTVPGGTAESVKTEILPVPQFGLVSSHFKPVSLGIGVFFPHGNGGKYSTASLNPFNPNEGRIYSLEIAPAVAVQLTDSLSMGMSLRIIRISSSLKGQLFPAPISLNLDDSSFSGWGIGASGGILYRPCKEFSLGANYRSEVSAKLSGDVEFTEPVSSTTLTDSGSYEQDLPTLITGGIAVKPVPALTVALQYSYERNKELQQLDLTLDTLGALSLAQNYTDSQTIHAGIDYRVRPNLALRAGYAKDLFESIPDAVMDRVTGDIAAHEVSAGLAYDWGRYTLSGTWNARFGSRTVPVNGTNKAPGKYEAFVHSASVAVGVRL